MFSIKAGLELVKGGPWERGVTICVCIHIYIYTRVHVHIYIYIYIHICMCKSINRVMNSTCSRPPSDVSAEKTARALLACFAFGRRMLGMSKSGTRTQQLWVCFWPHMSSTPKSASPAKILPSLCPGSVNTGWQLNTRMDGHWACYFFGTAKIVVFLSGFPFKTTQKWSAFKKDRLTSIGSGF